MSGPTGHDAAPAAAGPALAALRAGTRAAHAATEAIPCLARLLSPALTLREYAGALRGLHGFHAAWHAPELPPSVALPALQDDLAWFGIAPAVVAQATPCTDPATALGVRYVIEGSALGGRVIGRHVAATLGVRPGAGGSFFTATTAEAARQRWRGLCSTIEDGLADSAARERAVAAADRAFRWLAAWLTDGEPAWNDFVLPASSARGAGRAA